MSTATTTWPRLRKSISASANSVSSSVENAMTIAPAGTAARGASVPGRALELFAGTEHGVEHPVELALPDVGAEPPRAVAAERDDPGAITVA